jgi:hypothetical protein
MALMKKLMPQVIAHVYHRQDILDVRQPVLYILNSDVY